MVIKCAFSNICVFGFYLPSLVNIFIADEGSMHNIVATLDLLCPVRPILLFVTKTFLFYLNIIQLKDEPH